MEMWNASKRAKGNARVIPIGSFVLARVFSARSDYPIFFQMAVTLRNVCSQQAVSLLESAIP